jgi:hypothetical protein
VIGGAAGALALLVGVCLVAPVVARWRQRVSERERRELFPAPRVVVRSSPAAHI